MLEIFRNVGIRTRVVTVTILTVVLPVVVFLYIGLMNVEVQTNAYLFLGASFILVALISSFLAARSITNPVERLRRAIRHFLQKKVPVPVKDSGADELAAAAVELNKLLGSYAAGVASALKSKTAKAEAETDADSIRKDYEHQLKATRSCLEISRVLNTTLDFQTNLKAILDESIKSMGVQWASVLLLDRETLELEVACVRGIEQSLLEILNEEKYPQTRIKPTEGLAGLVMKEGLPLIANKGHKDARFKTFPELSSHDEKIASILCAPVKSSDGKIIGVLNFINRISPPVFRNEDLPFAQDVSTLTALVVERNNIYRSLFSDETTGLTSHSFFRHYLDEEVSRAIRYTQPVSLVCLEVDGYDELTRNTSQSFARAALTEMGLIVKETLRDIDIGAIKGICIRILLPNTDAAGAVYLVGRMRAGLAKHPFKFEGAVVTLATSAGIASFPEPVVDARTLSNCAENALKTAHEQGGNRAVVYGTHPEE